jgi:lysophospholipase L1-like esterase
MEGTAMKEWSTAYMAALSAPEDLTPFFPQPLTFSAQTVRQAVRLRRGGNALRLVLSNEFGREPLVIDEVTVSVGGPALPAPYQETTRWEIPAGATVTSDVVPLPTLAGDELVVSTFFAGTAQPSAYLHSAQRTGEIEPGGESFTSLYWISRVLTDAPADGPVVVSIGDSITRGDATSVDRDQRYPDHLQRRLATAAAGAGGAVVLNAGIGGNRLLGPLVGSTMPDRFERDVLRVPDATHVVIMGGINDIASGSPAGELIDALFTLARRAAERGIQPVLGTITPFMGSKYESFRADGNEEVRSAVNHAITSQRDWPVADFANQLSQTGDPTLLAAPYNSGDGVHPGDAGARALADAIPLDALRGEAA